MADTAQYEALEGGSVPEDVDLPPDEEQVVTISEEQLSKHGFICIGESYEMWKVAEYIFGEKEMTFAWHLLDIHSQYCETCKDRMLQMPDSLAVPKEDVAAEHADQGQNIGAGYTELSQDDGARKIPGFTPDRDQPVSQVLELQQNSADAANKDDLTGRNEVKDEITSTCIDEGKNHQVGDDDEKPDGVKDEKTGMNEVKDEITSIDEGKNNHVGDGNLDKDEKPDDVKDEKTEMDELLRSVLADINKSSTDMADGPVHTHVVTRRGLRSIRRPVNMAPTHKHRSPKKLHIAEPLPRIKRKRAVKKKGDGSPRLHICEHCGHVFTNTSNLTTHRRTHTGERPYACKTCGRQFARGDELKVHIRCHTGEKPYQCDFCGKMFAKRSGLSDHTRIHTGEKRYVCDVCHKAFTQSQVLKTHHDLKHSGTKKYQCELCGKAFAVKHCLKRHSYTHVETPKYDCGICGKSYSRRDNLILHNKTKHAGKSVE